MYWPLSTGQPPQGPRSPYPVLPTLWVAVLIGSPRYFLVELVMRDADLASRFSLPRGREYASVGVTRLLTISISWVSEAGDTTSLLNFLVRQEYILLYRALHFRSRLRSTPNYVFASLGPNLGTLSPSTTGAGLQIRNRLSQIGFLIIRKLWIFPQAF